VGLIGGRWLITKGEEYRVKLFTEGLRFKVVGPGCVRNIAHLITRRRVDNGARDSSTARNRFAGFEVALVNPERITAVWRQVRALNAEHVCNSYLVNQHKPQACIRSEISEMVFMVCHFRFSFQVGFKFGQ
jgi:hypothetical protein